MCTMQRVLQKKEFFSSKQILNNTNLTNKITFGRIETVNKKIAAVNCKVVDPLNQRIAELTIKWVTPEIKELVQLTLKLLTPKIKELLN